MPEDPRNIGPVCAHHAPRPDPKYRAKPLEFFFGGYVKLGFPGKYPDGKTALEHMWVAKIVKNENPAFAGELKGVLNNDPVLKMDCVWGDLIYFSRKEIEDFEPA